MFLRNRRCLLLRWSLLLQFFLCCYVRSVNTFTPATTNTARRFPSVQLLKQQHKDLVYKAPTSTTTATTSSSSFSSALCMVASVPKDDGSGISYGERSRRYRRDVFAYGDWIRHRDSERFIGNLVDIFNSGIVNQLSNDCLLLGFLSTCIVLYNSLIVTGYDGFFDGIHHNPIVTGTYPILSMPGAFFTLTSPFLSFLLGMFKKKKEFLQKIKTKESIKKTIYLSYSVDLILG